MIPKNATPTIDLPINYIKEDELTQREIEKLLKVARAVKRGETDKAEVSIAFGKKCELYIMGYKKAA